MDNPLLKKLKITSGYKVCILHAPENYLSALEPVPSDIKLIFDEKVEADAFQLFVTHGEQLATALKNLKHFLNPDTLLWITYPKKPSGIPTDLGMMHHWSELKPFGLRPVAAISVNEQCTALQIKPEYQVKKSPASNTEITKSEFGAYIDQEQRLVKLPEDLFGVLKAKPETLNFFDSLSFTNKKEYVLWFLTAKQEKTREERKLKIMEKLQAKKKNPSEK